MFIAIIKETKAHVSNAIVTISPNKLLEITQFYLHTILLFLHTIFLKNTDVKSEI